MNPKPYGPNRSPHHAIEGGPHTPYNYQSFDEGRIQTGPPLSQVDAWVYDRTYSTGQPDRIPASGTGDQNHSGRGPKNYRRSDDSIKDEVCHRLTEDSFLDASEIDVDVKDCIVTLKGSLPTRRDKRHAEDVAERAKGVKDVRNEITINDDARSVRMRGLY